MANEGEFPKINGDVLYASEVNIFSKANRMIAIGSTNTIGSATGETQYGLSNITTVGSVYVSGTNLLTNPCELDINYKLRKPIEGEFVIGLSGVQQTALACMTGSSRTCNFGHTTIYIGSPHEGWSNSQVNHLATATDGYVDNAGDTVGATPTRIFLNVRVIDNFDVTKPFNIIFGTRYNTGDSTYYYSINSKQNGQ